MKLNTDTIWSSRTWRSVTTGLQLIGLLTGLGGRTQAGETAIHNYENIIYNHAAVTPDDIVASVNIVPTGNTNEDVSQMYLVWDRISSAWEFQQGDVILRLIQVLTDPKSANVNKCAAAYYLAYMPASRAVDPLAANITLQFNGPASPPHRFPKMLPGEYMSVDALVRIGNPSIPVMIRNLAESDNAKVRELSLQVIVRIDGDKDISQLRLQKALKAEKDPQKQARLQGALKSLSEIK